MPLTLTINRTCGTIKKGGFLLIIRQLQKTIGLAETFPKNKLANNAECYLCRWRSRSNSRIRSMSRRMGPFYGLRVPKSTGSPAVRDRRSKPHRPARWLHPAAKIGIGQRGQFTGATKSTSGHGAQAARTGITNLILRCQLKRLGYLSFPSNSAYLV
jgi:hypothetical protein